MPPDRTTPLVRRCYADDTERIWEIINRAAIAYRGVIPADRWHEPYMTRAMLQHEIHDGVEFWGIDRLDELAGIMGTQDKSDVALIRHAYVHPKSQHRGIGTILLQYIATVTANPILVGTWAAATWAISFYERNGYRRVPISQQTSLLTRYWSIPRRQVETSVVLANQRWFDRCE
ncbi:MAG: GNAT family N-acetyltransferase [Gammaproteobacteria bacterium]|nr:GNAT family N-acetyltransferase [Gammaproteobacteria bacterium]MDH3468776.1 GNAT family N-acetyltransferase [Gammaproteobacteria bacterium]